MQRSIDYSKAYCDIRSERCTVVLVVRSSLDMCGAGGASRPVYWTRTAMAYGYIFAYMPAPLRPLTSEDDSKDEAPSVFLGRDLALVS